MGFPYLELLVRRYREEPRANPHGEVPPAVLFGDSVLERVSDNDTDQTKLGSMIRQRLGARCLVLSSPAYSSQHFADYARVLAALPTHPRLVILPVNIRCLSPQWEAIPRYRWPNHREALRRFLDDPEGPAPDLGPDTEGGAAEALKAQSRAIRVSSPLIGETTVGALEDIRDSVPETEQALRHRAAMVLVYHYGLSFEPDHPCLIAFGDIVRSLRAVGTRVLFYVTPINVDFAQRLGGEPMLRIVADKVAASRHAVTGAAPGDPGVAFHDFHDLCTADHFLHRAYMVEHLDQHGRALLADRIAEQARPLLAEG